MTENHQGTNTPRPDPAWLTRFHDWLSHWLCRLLIVGPDPTPTDTKANSDEVSVWDTILSWPVRLLLVGLALAVGRIWYKDPVGIQLGWGLQYGLLLAVSIVASSWLCVGLVNLGAAGLWFLFSWSSHIAAQRDPPRWVLADYITWLNRQIEHIEVLATWIAVALVWSHSLLWQLLGLAVIAFLGTKIINGIARTKVLGGGEPAVQSRAVLLMDRRRVIYAATLIGMFLLVIRAPVQWRTTFPLWLTVIPSLGCAGSVTGDAGSWRAIAKNS